MRRFFVEAIDPGDGEVLIRGREARHISSVLRMGKGDRIHLVDGEGRHYLALILDAGQGGVRTRIEARIPPPQAPPVKTILCQALLKGDHFEYVIQKTSELGVTAVIPFLSERTVVMPRQKGSESKMKRWAEIAKESAKQSGRDSPMLIEPPVDFKELVSRWGRSACVRLLLWEDEDRCSLSSFMKVLEPMTMITAIVGPEGGFSGTEVQSAKEAGFVSVSLGERILRADTAAVALAAILQYETGCLSRGNAERPF
jgi:16S rRNA (uracil1498-N3)-methyltransferase